MKNLILFILFIAQFTANGQQVVLHTAYSLLYSEEHEQAMWVAYTLTKEETIAQFSRSDNFRP